MPRQNPLTRVEQVASDLRRLADDGGDYLGPDARKALLFWHAELLAAINEIQQAGTGKPGAT